MKLHIRRNGNRRAWCGAHWRKATSIVDVVLRDYRREDLCARCLLLIEQAEARARAAELRRKPPMYETSALDRFLRRHGAE